MSRISGVVIVKNEENMIADCLDSLSFCDEIIVVDGGSEDRTAEIAQKMGAKVFGFKTDDFSSMRNFGRDKAKNDWILYVDADERVTASLSENIKYQISLRLRSGQANIKDSDMTAYKIKRKNFYLGNYEWPYIEKIERLFKKDRLKEWVGQLHETPVINGKVGELEGFLLHYTHRDLTSMLSKTIEWSRIEAKLRFDKNHPKMTWWRFPRVMITAFINPYITQKGWKAGIVGFIESMYQAFSAFITYARLWEMQNNIKNHPFGKLRTKIKNEK